METLMDIHPTPVLTEPEAAEYLGLSRSFLRQARSVRSRANTPGPGYVKIGRRYLRSDLDEFLNSNRVPGQAA
jgi:predicted DNA-binding transcriptional regulator AlpA